MYIFCVTYLLVLDANEREAEDTNGTVKLISLKSSDKALAKKPNNDR